MVIGICTVFVVIKVFINKHSFRFQDSENMLWSLLHLFGSSRRSSFFIINKSKYCSSVYISKRVCVCTNTYIHTHTHAHTHTHTRAQFGLLL